MFHLHKATQVTAAAPPDSSASDADAQWLADLYAYPSVPADSRPYLRANMIASLDGAASADGRTGDLGGPGDRLLFSVLRELADVIVVGARTAVIENYHPVTTGELFIVSASLNIPPDYATVADANTTLITCAAAPPERRRALASAGARIIDCGDSTIDLDAILSLCLQRDFHRVLCEGGPSLLGRFLDADLVDDLCLTIAPLLAGGDAPRIIHSRNGSAAHGMDSAHLATDDDGYLYTRWTRRA